jgi:DNA repair protein RecN (Recombination protein N)
LFATDLDPGLPAGPALDVHRREQFSSTGRGGQLSVGTDTVRPVLEELRITGLGVIDDTTLRLTTGMNAITGETGAGKTMVVTGLGLLFGGQPDQTYAVGEVLAQFGRRLAGQA